MIPEIYIYNVVLGFLKYLKADLRNNPLTETFVYKIFRDQAIGDYNFSSQLSQLLLREPGNDPRVLELRMFFDSSRAPIPTIHFNLPRESEKDNAMSGGVGLTKGIGEEDEQSFSRRFTSTHTLVVTSNNTLEVVGLYNLFKHMFISYKTSLETIGFGNITLEGGDISPYQEILPNVFMRSLSIGLDIDQHSPELYPETPVNDIVFNQVMKNG